MRLGSFCLHSLLALAFGLLSCGKKITQKQDKIYSRQLQQHVTLTIFSTGMPADKSQLSLLLLNDGQDVQQLKLTEILDSLHQQQAIGPLVVVAIHANNRTAEYGVAGHPDFKNRGSKAADYAEFVTNELYAYAKKMCGVQKFKTVAIAGMSQGGLSALDIAWNNASKINKAGIFSGSFWWRDKDITDSTYSNDKNRILLSTIRSSKKRPNLQYWFYAGDNEETSDRDIDGITDMVDDTRDVIQLLGTKSSVGPGDITYKEIAGGKHDYVYWSRAVPAFLVWAFPN
jgi:enterochelin esterase-like enzyme